jgi:hypothetical protein
MMKPITLTWRPIRRLLRSWGDKVLMVVVIVTMAIGLMRLGFRASVPTREPEPDDRGGSGIIVRDEVLHLWLPTTLIELARNQSDSSVAHTHQELRTFLERRGQENLWYAFTTRGHQVNGGTADMTFIRHPYRAPEHFGEFLDVLATAAGNPSRDPTSRYSGAEVHILSRELSEREPREVVEQLLSRPFPPCD